MPNRSIASSSNACKTILWIGFTILLTGFLVQSTPAQTPLKEQLKHTAFKSRTSAMLTETGKSS